MAPDVRELLCGPFVGEEQAPASISTTPVVPGIVSASQCAHFGSKNVLSAEDPDLPNSNSQF
ncbi:MAG: hypothetical protein ACLP6E_17830 [Acidimicrobiales bacterium]